MYQDAELVSVVDGQSYYTDGLNLGQIYEFQVFVFDVRNLPVANSRAVQVSTELSGVSEIIEPVPDESIGSRPFVEGTRISWRDPGWYQVLSQQDFTSLCEGGLFCDVTTGRYIVINHTTGMRWENILVVDSATQQRDTDGDGIPDFMDVDQTGGLDNNFDGIDDAFQS